MTPEVFAAVRSVTPTYSRWAAVSKRQLDARVRHHHAQGERAFVRSCAIVRDSTGVREFVRGVDVVRTGTTIGTRTYYVTPSATVEHVDEWT